MTKEEILKMEAGRLLDGIVAKEVMGWTMMKDSHCSGSPVANKKGNLAGMIIQSCPRYSTDITAAWQVVEKMRNEGFMFSINDNQGSNWDASFYRGLNGKAYHQFNEQTAPLAICRASLLALAMEDKVSRCPNCGLEKEVTRRDLLLALMVEAGARTNADFCRCTCKPGRKPPEYWKANDLTEDEAWKKGELAHKVWKLHHAPNMSDCRELNYGYAIIKDRIMCHAGYDLFVDITDEVLERMP